MYGSLAHILFIILFVCFQTAHRRWCNGCIASGEEGGEGYISIGEDIWTPYRVPTLLISLSQPAITATAHQAQASRPQFREYIPSLMLVHISHITSFLLVLSVNPDRQYSFIHSLSFPHVTNDVISLQMPRLNVSCPMDNCSVAGLRSREQLADHCRIDHSEAGDFELILRSFTSIAEFEVCFEESHPSIVPLLL